MDIYSDFFLIWWETTHWPWKEDEPADVIENRVQYGGTRCYLHTSVRPTKHKSHYTTLDMFCSFAWEGIYSM